MGKLFPTSDCANSQIVRRSSRANKGQHSKYGKTTGGTATGKKRKVDVVEDDEGEVRCLCGDNEDDGGFMIQCETCQKWQHGGCMGYETPDDVPDSYACELCRPDLYKDVSVKRENPAKRKKQKQDKEKVQFTTMKPLILKKGKKGESPVSEPPSVDEHEEDENMSEGDDSDYSSADDKPLTSVRKQSKVIITSPAPSLPKKASSPASIKSSPAVEKKKPPPIITTTPRRPSQSSQPARRASTSSATPSTPAQLVAQTPLATTFADLPDQRRVPAAKIFAKIFEPITPDKSEALGLSIEHALYTTFATSEPGYGAEYKNRFRSVSFNLKDPKNTSLRERVLNGTLTPEALVKLTNEELANQELRAQAEKIREEGVAQSVLKVQTGPRIRRTHKGEEIIGEDTPAISPTEATPQAPFASSARDVSPPSKVEEEGIVPASPKSPPSQRSREASPRIETSEPADAPIERKKSSPTFILENVWDRLRSPSTTEDDPADPMDLDILPVTDLPQAPISDPDIDRILGKEESDTVNSPPYSPSAYTYELPNVVTKLPPIWTGEVSMPLVATFQSQARFIGGPLSITNLPWSSILPATLLIDGRIAIDTTTKYLEAQRSSTSKDLIAIQLDADDETQRAQHEKLFRYFFDRQRFGVLTMHSPLVKDAYLVPLAVEQEIPDVIESMETHDIPRKRTDPYLIAILVIQKNIATAEVKRSPLPPTAVPAGATAVPVTSVPNPVSASPTTSYTPPSIPLLPLEQPAPTQSGLEALGLSAADIVALQSLFLAHPEIVNDPQISTNPAVLQSYLQQYLPSLQWGGM